MTPDKYDDFNYLELEQYLRDANLKPAGDLKRRRRLDDNEPIGKSGIKRRKRADRKTQRSARIEKSLQN